jgi:hypothetical protein
MFDAFIILIFVAYIAYSEYFHFKERKQLYSRIQAKDLLEYKRVEEPVKKDKEEKKVVHFV